VRVVPEWHRVRGELRDLRRQRAGVLSGRRVRVAADVWRRREVGRVRVRAELRGEGVRSEQRVRGCLRERDVRGGTALRRRALRVRRDVVQRVLQGIDVRERDERRRVRHRGNAVRVVCERDDVRVELRGVRGKRSAVLHGGRVHVAADV
jgi:hypothetical protein